MEVLQRLNDMRLTVYKVRIAGTISARTLYKLTRDLRKISSLRVPVALAVVVNSPGGSAVESSLIRQRLLTFSQKHKIPIYTFAECMAASGGYYVMTAGQELYISRSSLVGSIGALFSFINLKEFAAKHGVERRAWASSPHALDERLDPLREIKPETQAWLQDLLEDTHSEFKNVVEQARFGKLRTEDPKLREELFSGDLFTGEKAMELGLVDKIGHCDQVMQSIFPKARIVDLSKESPMDRVRERMQAWE
jgi:signal peptide peptidase SppA